MRRFVRASAAQISPLEPRRLLTTIDFPIDAASSFLRIYARLKPDEIVKEIPLTAQASDTDRASATGTLRADITKAGVRFAYGSNINLTAKSGAYLPDFNNAKSATYALTGTEYFNKTDVLATINASLRGMAFDASSSRKKLDKRTKLFPMRSAKLVDSAGNGEFTSRGEIIATGSGTLLQTVANANASAKLTGGSGSYAITMPVNSTFVADLGQGVLTYTLIGRIVGRQPATVQGASVAQAASGTPVAKSSTRVVNDVFGTVATII